MPVPQRLRFEVLKRDSFRCVYCGSAGVDGALEVDHVIPRADGGEDTHANLVTACRPCNNGKSSVSLFEVLYPVSARMIALDGYGAIGRNDADRIDRHLATFGATITYYPAHAHTVTPTPFLDGQHTLSIPPLGPDSSCVEMTGTNLHYWPGNGSRSGDYYRIPWVAIRRIQAPDGLGRSIHYVVEEQANDMDWRSK